MRASEDIIKEIARLYNEYEQEVLSAKKKAC